MLHPSTKKLIDKLVDMTTSSKIDWRDGDDDTCVYDTEGYRVIIGQRPSRLVLQDGGGRVLETVSDTILSGTPAETGNYAHKVDQMVSEARRQMTGATEIIDQIVTALDLDDEPDAEQAELKFPDQTEMTSRVAMLAEKVNGVRPEKSPEPAETDNVKDDIAAKSEQPEETPRDSVTALQAGLAGTAAVAVAGVTQLASNSGMMSSENEPSEAETGWDVPNAAETEHLIEQETEESEPVAGFSPISSRYMDPEDVVEPRETASEDVLEEADVPEAEPVTPAPNTAASFGNIGPFGANGAVRFSDLPETVAEAEDTEAEEVVAEDDAWIKEEALAEKSPVDLPELDEGPEPEPIIHQGTVWGQAEAVNALNVTPAELLEPLPVEVVVAEQPVLEAEPVLPAATEKEPAPAPVYQNPGRFLSSLAGGVSKAFDTVADTVSDVAEEAKEAVSDVVSDVKETVTEAVEDITAEDNDQAASAEEEVTEQAEAPKSVYKYNPWM